MSHHEKNWQLGNDEAANADIIAKMEDPGNETWDDGNQLFTDGHYVERTHDLAECTCTDDPATHATCVACNPELAETEVVAVPVVEVPVVEVPVTEESVAEEQVEVIDEVR